MVIERGYRKGLFSIYILIFLGMFISFLSLSTPLSKHASGDNARLLFQKSKPRGSQAKLKPCPAASFCEDLSCFRVGVVPRERLQYSKKQLEQNPETLDSEEKHLEGKPAPKMKKK